MCCLLPALFSLPSAAVAQTCKDSIPATTPDSRFIVHNNGTVTHKSTGLTWMRCSLGQTWDGKTCTGKAQIFDWQKGLQAAGSHDFAGHRDWRLPNKNELASILEERCVSPAVNAKIFPGTPSVYFWTSSPYSGVADGAWNVDFGYGAINASVKSGMLPVRLVRGNSM
jgi:hypothetical protein